MTSDMPQGGHGSSRFWVAKRKVVSKGKNESVSKQELLKGCYQGKNVTVLAILESLKFIVANNTFQPTANKEYP